MYRNVKEIVNRFFIICTLLIRMYAVRLLSDRATNTSVYEPFVINNALFTVHIRQAVGTPDVT